MNHDYITTTEQLAKLCDQLSRASYIAFDTEFVSEDTYRPDLCLVQVAWDDGLAVIDPKPDLDVTPFWKVLVSPGHDTLVHAGREEFLFCLRAVGQRPHNLFDIQLAAGLIGMEYPAAYNSLIGRLLNERVSKGETRTDWRRRPLSQEQLEYALLDVVYLKPMVDKIKGRLKELNRLSWMDGEIQAWQDDLAQTDFRERWRRVSGLSGLSEKGLAIVRELWQWRENESQRRNFPTRRVLRDDLLVELARRGSADVRQISAVRGFERGDLQRQLPKLSEAIQRALDLPPKERPRPQRQDSLRHLTVVGQFLSTALGSICREAEVAPSLTGTAQDVRDLIAYRLKLDGTANEEPPILAQGWRAEVVGRQIEELLAGRSVVRIADPLSDEPLVIEPAPGKTE